MDPEEPFEHRPINRGCGRHYGFDESCVMCQVTKKHDDELVQKFREEQKLKEKLKHDESKPDASNETGGHDAG